MSYWDSLQYALGRMGYFNILTCFPLKYRIINHNFIRLLPETCIYMFISNVDIYNYTPPPHISLPNQETISSLNSL